MSESLPDWRRSSERGNRALIYFMKWMALKAPDWILNPLIWGIAVYFCIFSGRTARDGMNRYLAVTLERKPSFVDRFRQIRTFAFVVLERVRLLDKNPTGFTFTATGESAVTQTHLEGRGGVLLGAHFGSFEAMRAFDRSLPGLRVRYLMFEDNAEMTADVLNAINPEVAAMVINVRDGQSAMLEVRDALSAGEFVAFLGDRAPSLTQRSEIAVDFLGTPFNVPRAPYLSALLAQVPLILCFAPRTGRRNYDIAFTEIYDGAAVARSERDRICRELAQTYADALADMCRKHPYNWFNFFDIWR